MSEDRFYYLTENGGIGFPSFLMPPLMSNHGCYVGSLGSLCRWLGEQAEALGVEIYPGILRHRRDVRAERRGRRRRSPATWAWRATARTRTATRQASRLPANTRCSPKARAARSRKQLIRRFSLDAESGPQKYGIGLKELWEVPKEKHRPGLVQHTMGWPLEDSTGGGSFLYHFGENLVSVGFVVHLDYANPYLNPFKEFQRAKLHPRIAEHLQGGRRISYGARALTEGGWQAIPRLAFPGGALIGCAAGFMNVPRIKGSHNAMLSRHDGGGSSVRRASAQGGRATCSTPTSKASSKAPWPLS